MTVTEVVPGLFQVSLGIVNAYLLVGERGVTLIDTGLPGRDGRIVEGLRETGRGPEGVHTIVITHLHADHTGGLASLRERTGATVYAHPTDAKAIRQGVSMRRVGPEGTWLGRVIGWADRWLPLPSAAPAEVDVEVEDGDVIPVAGGLEVIHAPGHSAGQIVLRWDEHGGVLIAADAAGRRTGSLGAPPLLENVDEAHATLHRLAGMEFEVAVFGHGDPIREGAAEAFRERFVTGD